METKPDNHYVKIKTWEEMETQYGLTDGGHIDCLYAFTIDMEECMPDSRIIQITENNKWYPFETGVRRFSISKDMIAEDNIKNIHETACTNQTGTIILNEVYKLKNPIENHMNDFYVAIDDDSKSGYLWDDGLIHEQAMSFTDKSHSGYYPTFQSALFHKLKYERIHKDALREQS